MIGEFAGAAQHVQELDGGVYIAQIGHIGPDGQQTVMSTMQREQETRRVRDVIARDCGPLPKETP